MNLSQQQSTEINQEHEAMNVGEPSQHPQKANKRPKTSEVWEHFTEYEVISPDDNQTKIKKAKCKYCPKVYTTGSHRYGTTTLSRHLEVCNLKPKYNDVGAMLIDHDGKLRANKIDHNVVREKISMAIIVHDLPYSFVEYHWIRDLLKYLNSDYKFMSRNTAAADVYKLYEREKEKLKYVFTKIPSRICLTSDIWTACTTEGYICLTAHYIDNNWKLNSKILSFCAMPPPHTGSELAKKLLGCLKEWGIEKKVFSLTLDNATNNDRMQNILKEQLCLQNDLMCNGEFFHVRCSAHILNLIVQDGLKLIDDAVYKIRASVSYVRQSERMMKLFQECVEKIGIKLKHGLSTDVATRWNSTYKMLDAAIKYQRAFSSLKLLDTNYEHCPSHEEWVRGEKMCEFLMPFNEITNLISGSTYPTSNLYFRQVWKIEYLLTKNMESEDEVIKKMACTMRVKFDKYWEQYSVILAMGAIFDPRMKFKLLEFCYKKLDENTYREKLDHIRSKLYMLFEAYKVTSSTAGTSSSTITTSAYENEALEETHDAFDDEFHEYCVQGNKQNGKSALDVYLDEPQMDSKSYASMDILHYWKDNMHRFGELSYMACDVLSIPITTVASESAFSIGGRVLSKYRSSLLLSNVQALLCARSWIRGFELEENDGVCDGDEDVPVPTEFSAA